MLVSLDHSTTIAAIKTDAARRVVAFNNAAKVLLKLNEQAHVGQPLSAILSQEINRHLDDSGNAQGGYPLVLDITVDGKTTTLSIEPLRCRDSGAITLLLSRVEATSSPTAVSEQLRAVLENVADGVVIIDERGIIQSLNGAAERIFGYEAHEMTGQNVKMLMPDEYAIQHDQFLHNYLETGEAKVLGIGREVHGRRKDGSFFELDLSVAEMHFSGKRMFTGIVRDISEQRKAQRREQDLNVLLDAINTTQSRYIKGVSGEVIFSNILSELLRLTDSEYGFIGQVLYDDTGMPYLQTRAITHIARGEEAHKLSDDGRVTHTVFPDLDTLFGEVIRAGGPVVSNDPAAHPAAMGLPAGLPHLSRFLGVPLKSGENLIGMVGLANRQEGYDKGMVRDLGPYFNTCANIIERVRSEEQQHQLNDALRESEDRLARSQEFANIGTWDWDIQSGELYWSERIAPLFGYPTGMLETTYENFIGSVHPDDRKQVIDAVNACIEKGVEYNIEHRCVWPDGTVRWMLEKGDVVRSDDGAPLRMLGVVQDVTARKQAELDLLIAKEEAEQANQAKSEFLSSMSHELRTPLNAILGFTQLLSMDHNLSESHLRNIADISQAGKHLLELINDVLDLARIEAGRLDLAISDVSLAESIEQSLALMESLARERGVQVVTHPDQYEGVTVRADETRLRQVLLNLLSNGVKYNRPDGNVELTVHCPDPDTVEMAVHDTGMGISASHIEKLFTPFNRLAAGLSNIEGTGIGLVITRQLVEAMGGEIAVASEVNKGSVFTVTLQTASSANAPEKGSGHDIAAWIKRRQADAQHATAHVAASRPEHSARILVVEDHDVNRDLLLQQLRTLGYEADYAANGQEALQRIEAQHYDLILTDCNMPLMNGYDMTRAVRNLEQVQTLKPVPIIAFTANAHKKDRENCVAAGMNDILVKPVDIHKLNHKIIHWLNHGASQDRVTPVDDVEKATPDNTASLVDMHLVRQYIGPDPDKQQRVLKRFAQSAHAGCDDIVESVNTRSAPTLKNAAHKLKGAARYVGATGLADLCARLEDVSDTTDWRVGEGLCQDLERMLADLDAAIEKIFLKADH